MTDKLRPFRWQSGRQGTGYEKMLLAGSKWLLPFDAYLLRYKPGAGISTHTDPVEGKRHYRLNIVLRAGQGGEFVCDHTIWRRGRVVLFRPDENPHSVTPVSGRTRYVFSFGWVLPAKS